MEQTTFMSTMNNFNKTMKINKKWSNTNKTKVFRSRK